MKLIVAADIKLALVNRVSMRTKWNFSEVVALINETIEQAPDVSGLILGKSSPEPIVLQGAGILAENTDPNLRTGVSEEIHNVDKDTQVLKPVLPKTDPRPVMLLDPADEAGTNDAVKALAEHTKSTRK